MIERLVSKRGARIVSAAGEGSESNDPASQLMRRLVDSFAEYERLIISARTKSALAAKRQRGERISGIIPFGFSLAADGCALQPCEPEQQTLILIRECRANGLSLRSTADALNARGVCTRAGGSWRFEYVRALVNRAA
jgi:DNA invertase Pin-like site-specific DNA recombinase